MTPNVTPKQAVEDFLAEREGEVSKASHRNYKYALKELLRFCENQGIEEVGEIHGYHLKQYKLRRRGQGIKEVTLKNNLSTLRVFLRWCEQAELLERGTAELVQLPKLDEDDRVSDDTLSQDRVEDILDYFYKFEYAQRRHAIFQLIWHTCLRMGTVVAIDLEDYLSSRKQIKIRHRPETGTPLKNGIEAQRKINISDSMQEVLDDYIEGHRHNIVEESGREPLFTTRNQRVSRTALRKNTYGITRPCKVHGGCPHNRTIEECDAAVRKKDSSKCPSSMSPHPLRRAAITYHLNQEWPNEKLSERANVTVDVLEDHYDTRQEDEKAVTRKQYLDNL
ncbi:integrase family protein [Haloterrigena salina JCM 13891]|uniref:Integrase family protein n=1 Tax=Haloterrigena salina JCM 13891 TaxID=1227488 RepID=M0C3A3_9EURY|nr:tyrosine-type recombinase/integrase [Haloterrigena salina]ELZ16807.1 integrase family protein [Haloterrigena salina JCM 13891]